MPCPPSLTSWTTVWSTASTALPPAPSPFQNPSGALPTHLGGPGATAEFTFDTDVGVYLSRLSVEYPRNSGIFIVHDFAKTALWRLDVTEPPTIVAPNGATVPAGVNFSIDADRPLANGPLRWQSCEYATSAGAAFCIRWNGIVIQGPTPGSPAQSIYRLTMTFEWNQQELHCDTQIEFVNPATPTVGPDYVFVGVAAPRTRFALPGFDRDPTLDTSAMTRAYNGGFLYRRPLHASTVANPLAFAPTPTGGLLCSSFGLADTPTAIQRHLRNGVPTRFQNLQLVAFYDDLQSHISDASTPKPEPLPSCVTPTQYSPTEGPRYAAGRPCGSLLLFGTRDIGFRAKVYDIELSPSVTSAWNSVENRYVPAFPASPDDAFVIFQPIHYANSVIQTNYTLNGSNGVAQPALSIVRMADVGVFVVPYKSYVALTQGDWYDAAYHYRHSFALDPGTPWTNMRLPNGGVHSGVEPAPGSLPSPLAQGLPGQSTIVPGNPLFSSYFLQCPAWMTLDIDYRNDAQPGVAFANETSAWVSTLNYTPSKLAIEIRSWWPSDADGCRWGSFGDFDTTNPDAAAAINEVYNLPGASDYRFMAYFIAEVNRARPLALFGDIIPIGLREKLLGSSTPFTELYPAVDPTRTSFDLPDWLASSFVIPQGISTLYSEQNTRSVNWIVNAPGLHITDCASVMPETKNWQLQQSHSYFGDYLAYYWPKMIAAFQLASQGPTSSPCPLAGIYFDNVFGSGMGQFSPEFLCAPPPQSAASCTVVSGAALLVGDSSIATLDRPVTTSLNSVLSRPPTLGGGGDFTKRARQMLFDARVLANQNITAVGGSSGSQGFFVQEEYLNENAVGVKESGFTYQIFGVDGTISNEVAIPLFATVYHDYMMGTNWGGCWSGALTPMAWESSPTGVLASPNQPLLQEPLPIVVGQGTFGNGSNQFSNWLNLLCSTSGDLLRRPWAQSLQYGNTPSIGQILGTAGRRLTDVLGGSVATPWPSACGVFATPSISQNWGPISVPPSGTGLMSSIAFTDYYLSLVRRTLVVWANETVRRFTVFGQRLRDPIVEQIGNATNALFACGLIQDRREWQSVPSVLASMWRSDVDLSIEQSDRIAIGLVNWTHPSRDAIATQSLAIRFDSNEAGFLPGSSYRVLVVTESLLPEYFAVPVALPGTLTVPPGGGEIRLGTTYPIVVPSLSAIFFIFEPL